MILDRWSWGGVFMMVSHRMAWVFDGEEQRRYTNCMVWRSEKVIE